MNPILSIVIVEYLSENEINNCIQTISANINVPHEIIISSNSCYDKNKQNSIHSSQKNVRWIFNERNGGFAYAMNQGLRIASGDYLVIMNSDCIINSDLTRMIRFMQSHKEIGAIAPKVKDAENNIQDTARPYVSLPRFILRQTKRILKHKISVLEQKMNYDKIQTVDWVIGAFIMTSRKAYEQTGGLDESFFMYAEDLDWCTRIREAGLEVVYYPHAMITYKGTRRARSNKKYARIFINSHIHYWRKFGFFYGYPKRKIINYEE